MAVIRINDIIDKVLAYSKDAQVQVIMGAYVYAAGRHDGQVRKSGEDYLVHPLAVADILADLRMDVDTIAVGLLHDTMEDCLATYGEIEAEFGPDIARMVDGVTKIGKLQFSSREVAQAENFRKLVLAMAHDVRVILVKLADRLHNMRTLDHMRPDRQQAISQETMDIFAPIANRLGLSQLKMELEDLCFRYLHPEDYARLTEKLGSTEEERRAYIERASAVIREHLAENGLEAEVTGRPKHLTSIHRKMRDQHLDFEQLHDVLAFRIIVEELGECYTALGLVHSRWRHLPERLKDYIANPKSNGYQSLHTVVLGPEGRQIEVQIRTREMHRVAEYGIAAHWRYKEGHLALSREDLNKITRLRELFEAARDVEDPTEFMEAIKVDLFSDEIFVFTPKGDVKFFPRGATVLDFAYAIHTEVGHTCVGARVNGRMVPLRTVLRSGDRVEILTRPDQKPNRDWLEIAHTGRALTKIRRALREEERARGTELGRELLEAELKKRGRSLARMLRAGDIEAAAKRLGHRKPEHLYLALAQGHVSLHRVLREMLPADEVDLPEDDAATGVVTGFLQKLRKRAESPVLISGEEDVLVTYARCCNPLPGEPVAGYITQGRGITVHVANCPQLLALAPERRVRVDWHRRSRGTHSGELRIVCSNRTGMVADIGGVCKSLEININHIASEPTEDGRTVLSLEVNVSDVRQLTRLMRNIEKIDGVFSVERVREAPRRPPRP